MAFSTIFNAKANAYNIFLQQDVAFSDLEKLVGSENQPANFEYNGLSFYSDRIEFLFPYNDIVNHLNENPTSAYLEIVIEYKVESSDPSTFYEVQLLHNFTLDGKMIGGVISQTKNTNYTNADDNDIVSAKFRVYANSLPMNSILGSNAFAFNFGLYCKNPNASMLIVTIESIQINIYSSTGGSYITTYDKSTKRFSEENEIIELGLVNVMEKLASGFSIYNFGTQDLFIENDGITSELTDFVFEPKVDKIVLKINSGKSLDVPFLYQATTPATAYEATVSIRSTANNLTLSANTYQIVYKYNSVAQKGGTLEVFYEDQKLTQNEVLSFSTVPQKLNSSAILVLKNVGFTNLVIQKIETEGSVFATAEKIPTNTNISPGGFVTVEFDIMDAIVGEQRGSIIIKSTDVLFPVYALDVKFVVKEKSKFEIRDGATVNYANNLLSNLENINLGILDRDRGYKKFYTLTNDGIYSDLRVNSIQLSTNHATIAESPTLPFVLLKNKENSMTFAVSFDTQDGVNKEVDINIDYVEI